MQKSRFAVTGLLLSCFCFADLTLSQSRPKDHYRLGEQLLKQDQVYDAFQEFRDAASLDPRNRKYQSKLAEAGKAASLKAEAQARQYLNPSGESPNPSQAQIWLRKALEYDSANASAAQELELLQRSFASALQRIKDAQGALDRGDLRLAADLADSVTAYREVVLGVSDLEEGLSAARRVSAAQELWEKRKDMRALEELSATETQAPNSVFVSAVSKKLRREISDELISRASAIPTEPPSELLQKMQLTKAALATDKANDKAFQLKTQTSTAWAELFLSQLRSLSATQSKTKTARVSLETFRLAEGDITHDPPYAKGEAELKSWAYPALRVSLALSGFANCPPSITKDGVREAIGEALKPVALVGEREQSELTLSVNNFSCSSTEIPRQALQQINSTYVAGHNQLVNPGYVKLQEQLNYAQQQLDRASAEAQINPGFGSGFAKGWWQGTVRKLERALAATPPYIMQEVVQQYQYEKFEAYRSYQIECRLLLFNKTSQQEFASEKKVSFVADDRKEGISGVLPEDRSGARNVEPTLLPLDQYAGRASDGLKAAIGAASRELVAGYFATSATDRRLGTTDRLAALLYTFDVSDGTLYQKEKAGLASMLKSALSAEISGSEGVKPFLDSHSLPVPEQSMVSNRETERAEQSRFALEETIQGVVAIETDAGNGGSGFFLIPACFVVTNEHVIEGAGTIILRTASKGLYVGQVLAKDDRRDLALLGTNAHTCKALRTEDPVNATIGQDIYAIGNPLGLSETVTKGIISAFRITSSGVHYIQLK